MPKMQAIDNIDAIVEARPMGNRVRVKIKAHGVTIAVTLSSLDARAIAETLGAAAAQAVVAPKRKPKGGD